MPNKIIIPPQLWHCRVGEHDVELPLTVPTCFSSSEKQRLKRIRSPRRKHQFIQSRLLIRQALSHLFSKPLAYWQLEENDNAPPRIINLPELIHLSLSHTQNAIVLALSTHRIGVDIERNKQRHFAEAATLFMTKHELQQFQQHPTSTDFYRSWCLKEAFFKAQPQQAGLNLKNIDTLPIRTNKNSSIIEFNAVHNLISIYIDVPITTISIFTTHNDHDNWLNLSANQQITVERINYKLVRPDTLGDITA